MHENLKFSIKLSESIKPFHDGTTFNPIEDKNRIADWQAIFSGYDYNTQYLIYTKFIGNKLTKDSFEVNKVQLFIQNYTGNETIGFINHKKPSAFFEETKFVNEDPKDPENDIRLPAGKKRRFKIKVGLQAFNNNLINDDVKKYNNEDSFVINNGDILEINTFFTPANPEASNIYDATNRNKSFYVDEKFMERIGEDIKITDSGAQKLLELNELGLISNEHLDAALAEKKEYFKTVISNTKKNTDSMKALFGRVYPCIPKNSIFYVD